MQVRSTLRIKHRQASANPVDALHPGYCAAVVDDPLCQPTPAAPFTILACCNFATLQRCQPSCEPPQRTKYREEDGFMWWQWRGGSGSGSDSGGSGDGTEVEGNEGNAFHSSTADADIDACAPVTYRIRDPRSHPRPAVLVHHEHRRNGRDRYQPGPGRRNPEPCPSRGVKDLHDKRQDTAGHRRVYACPALSAFMAPSACHRSSTGRACANCVMQYHQLQPFVGEIYGQPP